MELGTWLGGSLLLAVMGASAACGSWRLRNRILPDWEGPPARLAEAVIALATLIGVSQLLGAVGAFERAPVVAGVVAVSGALAALGRGRHPRAETRPAAGEAPDPTERLARLAAVAAVAVVAGQWATFTFHSLRTGIVNADSLWYHLPRAARFVQTGWVTRLHHTAPEFPDTFHPSNVEVAHALPMLAYGRDGLAPILNVGWLALLLLAAWCVGRPFGRGAVSLAGVAALAASPLVLAQQAGTAGNDIAALCLLLAAVALLLQPGGGRAAVAVAAVAAGLGLSTKLTVVPPIAVLTIGVVWAGAAGERARRAVAWLVPLVAFGSYWYVRSWVTVGSPVPSADLPLFPTPRFRVVEEQGFSVADYLVDGQVWRDWFLPGLRFDFGWAWPAVALSLLAAVVLAVRQRSSPLLRILGVAVAVTTVAYVALPTTALGDPGRPVLFAANLIYLTPALVVGLALLPLLEPLTSRRSASGLLVAYLGVLVVGSTTSPFSTVADGRLALGVAVAVAVALLGAGLVLRPPPARVLLVGAGAAALVAGAVLFPLADRYVTGRYADRPFYRWANEVSGARVAVAGFGPQFPFYGTGLDNRVEYVGEIGPHGEFHDLTSCSAWRRQLRAGRFDLVVLRAERSDTDRNQLRWTEGDPAATLALEADGGSVFRFDPTVPDPGCP